MHDEHAHNAPGTTRRKLLRGMALGGAAAGFGVWREPAWALATQNQAGVLAGNDFELSIGRTPVNITGRTAQAITVNGSLPGPILRWREGELVTLRVHNTLPQMSAIHWHGILLPANMDGVPGLSFHGIAPGGDYLYRFRVRQSGTYWYHSHSSLQEQAGVYGALIIDPAIPEPFAYERDYVVMLSDGQNVHPVDVDEFRIAPAETFDVIVQPERDEAYVVFAQAMDRSGHARITLAPRMGMRAPSPAPDKRALLTMDDMGHGGHAAASGEMRCGASMGMEGGCGANMSLGAAMQAHPASETGNPFVDMQTMSPTPRLDDPGIGLRDNGRRVLRYADLRSLQAPPDGRTPSREIELHLTGHMERFTWGFDGIRFSDAEPVRLTYGERVRVTLVNDTMMEHPVHLHGMWSDLEDEHGDVLVRKHTISIPPGTRRSFRVTADALGRWAFHCHMLMHMEAGMMREVRVEE